MDNQSLQNSINRGVISPVYLFYGTEKLLIDQAIKKIKDKILSVELEDFNFAKLDGEKASAAQIIEYADTLPIMAEKRLLIVDNPVFLASQKKDGDKFSDKTFINYLENPNIMCCLIFRLVGKADKRKKLFKLIEKNGQVVEFSALKGEKLERWIRNFLKENGKKIELEALEYLALAANEGLDVLENELDKLVMYVGEKTNILVEDVREVVTKNSQINIFDLIDAIAGKEGRKALELLRQSISLGEPPLKLLYLLVKQFRIILIAKDLVEQGYSEKQIKEKIQAHPYVITKALRQGKIFSMKDLSTALAKMLDTELQLKSSGGEPLELLENVVISLCFKNG